MGEFISWVEHEGQVLFFDSSTVRAFENQKGLSSKSRYSLSHGALNEFFNLNGKGAYKQDSVFWNGAIPFQIKDAWNAGKLDGLLHYLGPSELEHVLRSAPVELSAWVVAKTDPRWFLVVADVSKTRDYYSIRNGSDFWVLVANNSALARRVASLTTSPYVAEYGWKSKIETECVMRIVEYAAAKNFDVTQFKRPIIE